MSAREVTLLTLAADVRPAEWWLRVWAGIAGRNGKRVYAGMPFGRVAAAFSARPPAFRDAQPPAKNDAPPVTAA